MDLDVMGGGYQVTKSVVRGSSPDNVHYFPLKIGMFQQMFHIWVSGELAIMWIRVWASFLVAKVSNIKLNMALKGAKQN